MRTTHISPEYNYTNVNGTLSMIEKKSFFGSKLMKFDNSIEIKNENIIYYQTPINEQLNLDIEKANNPIIYDTVTDKLNNSILKIDETQTESQKNDKTSWILSIEYNKLLINYLFATLKKWRTFEGIKNSTVMSNDINVAIKEYINNNLLSRYQFDRVDLFISYNSLTDGNLRFKNNWDSNLQNTQYLVKTFDTNTDSINGTIQIKFDQEQSSLNYSYNYYYNLYFKKL